MVARVIAAGILGSPEAHGRSLVEASGRVCWVVRRDEACFDGAPPASPRCLHLECDEGRITTVHLGDA